MMAVVRRQVDQEDDQLRGQVGVRPQEVSRLMADQLRLHRDGGPLGSARRTARAWGRRTNRAPPGPARAPRNQALNSSQKRRSSSGSDAVQPSARSRWSRNRK